MGCGVSLRRCRRRTPSPGGRRETADDDAAADGVSSLASPCSQAAAYADSCHGSAASGGARSGLRASSSTTTGSTPQMKSLHSDTMSVASSHSVLSSRSAVSQFASSLSRTYGRKTQYVMDDNASDVPTIAESIADMRDFGDLDLVVPSMKKTTMIDSRQHPLAPWSESVEGCGETDPEFEGDDDNDEGIGRLTSEASTIFGGADSLSDPTTHATEADGADRDDVTAGPALTGATAPGVSLGSFEGTSPQEGKSFKYYHPDWAATSPKRTKSAGPSNLGNYGNLCFTGGSSRSDSLPVRKQSKAGEKREGRASPSAGLLSRSSSSSLKESYTGPASSGYDASGPPPFSP
eukprot:TRINITY_DN22994_c0_g1_i1.p1 TRINITY_DN22994_c0_g1~~TRINITY_DN22994_c0_g1_i1.p1  ORF type:complete len:349 (-),score=50.52 TRINITY_DN22994_c0_g1_i1:88-1134(-)